VQKEQNSIANRLLTEWNSFQGFFFPGMSVKTTLDSKLYSKLSRSSLASQSLLFSRKRTAGGVLVDERHLGKTAVLYSVQRKHQKTRTEYWSAVPESTRRFNTRQSQGAAAFALMAGLNRTSSAMQKISYHSDSRLIQRSPFLDITWNVLVQRI